ncbi:hypothetical protein CNMCM5793_001809 [Aspergillus hiratsukae]|uniref:BRCT domain-containing protein n=1 Tax=Aspergillus hiratsukae TaxID=1194566 RepID=A0A8H6PBT3_9EURO|nr:hypothetical protein CNMCM5793_001809 [Aspergillus hiratsukae]KAF7170696.1 hypothetical protein CNMCM6106_005295 [Aspergillus hiratsukae]
MGKTFKNIHACAIGRCPVNADKIAQWIRAHGGTFSKDVTDGVTHLITTKETFEKNVEAVQKAKLLETVKIVTYDWLEDSLQSKTRKPKPEGAYLLANLPNKEKKKQRRAAKVQTRQMKAKEKSSAPGNDSSSKPTSRTSKGKALTASNYHVYVDQDTEEAYSATIYRQLSRNNTREKYQIKIHESNDVPHIYATHAKYSRTGKSTDEFLAPLVTGKNWEHRLDGTPMPPKQDAEGKQLPAHEGWFYYETGRSLLSNFLRQREIQSTAAGKGAEQIAVGSSNDDRGLLTPPGDKDESIEDQT